MREYRIFVSRDGYNELFAQKNAMYEHQYCSQSPPNFADPARFESFRLLQRIADLAASHHIALFLVIYPYHADFLDILQKCGLWPSFDEWKRALVRIATRREDAPAPLRIYDFSGYNRVTTERVPPLGDKRDQMRWYWESGHFKAALGDLIIARIFGSSSDFGYVLDSEDVSEVISDIRTGRDRYRAAKQNASVTFVPEGR